MVRGALRDGLTWAALERPLAQAALAHYADFGHSAIYVLKTGQLLEALGPEVAEPLLLALVRSLVYAFREELIPEFKGYGPALAAWDGSGTARPELADFGGQSLPQRFPGQQLVHEAMLEGGAGRIGGRAQGLRVP